MAIKVHDEHSPGCPECNAAAGGTADLCTCITDGFAEGLKRWSDSCPCCFSDAYPQGLPAAIAEAGA
ncbi:MAG: hypothetical protein NVS9B1_18720 [Candidatus Dormibacteraceae bacterium]